MFAIGRRWSRFNATNVCVAVFDAYDGRHPQPKEGTEGSGRLWKEDREITVKLLQVHRLVSDALALVFEIEPKVC